MQQATLNQNKLKLKKLVLTVTAFVSLLLGIVGVVIPIMPTTPFILLAAICLTAGNNKIAQSLRRSPFFGSYIENFHTKQGVSKALKVFSIIFVWTGLAVSALITKTLWISIVLAAVGVGVTIHLLLIKTKTK